MNKTATNSTILCAALVGLMTTVGASNASATDAMSGPTKEMCFGIAKAGKNDCKSVIGNHSCANQAKTDNDISEFKLVDVGFCAKNGGTLTAPAIKPTAK